MDESWPRTFSPHDVNEFYCWLMEIARSPNVDTFDAHVTASIVAIAFAESRNDGTGLNGALGLSGADLTRLIAGIFPLAVGLPELAGPTSDLERSADETCLLDLLTRCTTSRTAFRSWLASMIARRAQRPNHLWQDLGLRDRTDLSELMKRHFKPLAMRNSQDMKWKKFLYRMICADASFTLCTAPSCSECDDFDQCFGEETGESLLARIRRQAEIGA